MTSLGILIIVKWECWGIGASPIIEDINYIKWRILTMESKFNCRDCDFKTDNAAEFTDHCHQCKVNPVPMPAAEIERLKDARKTA